MNTVYCLHKKRNGIVNCILDGNIPQMTFIAKELISYFAETTS